MIVNLDVAAWAYSEFQASALGKTESISYGC